MTTWNSRSYTNATLSGSDLTVSWSGYSADIVLSTDPKTTGKHYFEITYDVAETNIAVHVGIHTSDVLDPITRFVWTSDSPYGWPADLLYEVSGGVVNEVPTDEAFAVTNTIGVAVDLDAGKIWFSKNAAWFPAQVATLSNPESLLTLTNSDLTATLNDPANESYTMSTTTHLNGKRYFEFVITDLSGTDACEACVTSSADTICYLNSGEIRDAVWDLVDTVAAYTTGDVIGVARDMESGKIWFSKNGTWLASGNPSADSTPLVTYGARSPSQAFFRFYDNGDSPSVTAHFSTASLTYSLPTGFTAWNTAASDPASGVEPQFVFTPGDLYAAYVNVGYTGV